MKQVILWFVLVIIALAILAGVVLSVMWAGRVASDAFTTVEVIEPEPGVRCAKMLTTTRGAISCWKVSP